jgi:hypothetical protein
MVAACQLDQSLSVTLLDGQGRLALFQISYRYGLGQVGIDQLLTRPDNPGQRFRT